jgi:hypothetical protein
MSNRYVLEVIKFNTEKEGVNGWLNKCSKMEHVGYMKSKFKTKANACSYYNKHHPHMRKLNAHKTYQSDWDLDTKLLYIVRKDYGLYDSIHPFSESDLPIAINGKCIYPNLK